MCVESNFTPANQKSINHLDIVSISLRVRVMPVLMALSMKEKSLWLVVVVSYC